MYGPQYKWTNGDLEFFNDKYLKTPSRAIYG